MRVTVFKVSEIYQQNKGIIIKSTAHIIQNLTVHLSYFTAHRIMILQHCTKEAQCCIVKYYERQKNKQSWLCLPTPGETTPSKQFR